MKPIAIIQHSPEDSPGHFATYLERHALPWRVYRSDLGDLPSAITDHGGLALMGGPMSAYDDLPWIPRVLDLIREAVDAGVPSIGHCLGGQLMAKALGAEVTRSPVKEIGWFDVSVANNAEAEKWFGQGVRNCTVFEWHGDVFDLPQGATRLLSSAHCENQAFSVGVHLGLQCHVEMTPDILLNWCASGGGELRASASPTVQSVEEMQRNLGERLGALNVVADRLYHRWTAGVLR
jgi:GMP synthase-like glutamine amidotransferase